VLPPQDFISIHILRFQPTNAVCPTNLRIPSTQTFFRHPPNGGTYDPNESCSWVVSGQSGLFTRLTIAYATESCCDFVYVYEGSTRLSSLRGFGSSTVTASDSGADLTVRFTSDYSVQYSGFNVTVQYVSSSGADQCTASAQISPATSYFSFPSNGQPYGAQLSCGWAIPAVPQSVLSIAVSFNLEYQNDYVTLYEVSPSGAQSFVATLRWGGYRTFAVSNEADSFVLSYSHHFD
jgi:hypothetical protein